jgi:hypothetical protein
LSRLGIGLARLALSAWKLPKPAVPLV